MLVSACSLSTYRIFKVRFFFRFHLHAGFSSPSILRVWSDRGVACLWQVGGIVGLGSLVGYHVR
jgi:hypothetical protein